MFVLKYYRLILKSRFHKVESPEDLYWKILTDIVRLWNRPSWVEGSTVSQITTNSKHDGLSRILSSSPLLAIMGIALWPLISFLVTILRSQTGFLKQWRLACQRPDLFLSYARQHFSDEDRADIRPDLIAGFFDGYDFDRTQAAYYALNNKKSFYDACATHNLPIPRIFSLDEALAAGGPWVVKDPVLDRGEGVRIVKSADELRNLTDDSTLIIQKKLKNLSEIIKLIGSDTPLSTYRIITVRKANGYEVLGSWLRMGRRHAEVDNAATGGIAALVDPATRRLLPAVSNDHLKFGISDERPLILSHPDTQVRIDSIILQSSLDAEALALKSHEILAAQASSIGWDIASCEEGTVLIEMNFFAGSFFPKPGSQLFHKQLKAMYLRYQEIQQQKERS